MTDKEKALAVLQAAEAELGPDYTDDGLTEDMARDIVEPVREAAKLLGMPDDVDILYTWAFNDMWGYGGDSDLLAMRPKQSPHGRHKLWSIAIPFREGVSPEDVVTDLLEIIDGKKPDYTSRAKYLPDGGDDYNAAWKWSEGELG